MPKFLTFVVSLLTSVCVFAEEPTADYSDRMLQIKELFSRQSDAALSQPYVGVTRDGQIQKDLFAIRATGVTTKPIVAAAGKFLRTLTPEQKFAASIPLQIPNGAVGRTWMSGSTHAKGLV